MYGSYETWKIVYSLPPNLVNNGNKGVALIEARNHQHAMNQFQEQYAGQYFTIYSCTRLLG